MSQKTNPTSLRLQKSNRYFPLCWYSDYFYGQKNEYSWKIRLYIETLSNQIGYMQMLPYLQTQFKRLYMYLFFLDMRGIQQERKRGLKMSRRGFQSRLSSPPISPTIREKIKKSYSLLSFFHISKEKKKELEALTFVASKRGGGAQENHVLYNSIKKANVFNLQHKQKAIKGIAFIQRKELPFFVEAQESRIALFKQNVIQTCWFGAAKAHVNMRGFVKPLAVKGGLTTDGVASATDGGGCLAIPFVTHEIFAKPLALQERFWRTPLAAKRGLTPPQLAAPVETYAKPQGILEALHKSLVDQRGFAKIFTLSSLANDKASTVGSKTRVFEAPPNENVALLKGFDRTSLALQGIFSKPLVLAQKALRKSLALKLEEYLAPSGARLGTVRNSLASQESLLKPSFALLGEQESFHQKPKQKSDPKVSIYAVRVLQDAQNAIFVANSIVDLLQKNGSFRQIKDQILRELKKNEIIKGIRLSCSGRVGGPSKKAQKSKTQSMQWGQTELHLFSSKLSFAKKGAATPFGKIGVKVWLCFK